jgi:hypothetical protein
MSLVSKRRLPVVETNYGDDGRTMISKAMFDENGMLVSGIEYQSDGETPGTVTGFRSNGTVSFLISYANNGNPETITSFDEDGVEPTSVLHFDRRRR